MDSRIRLRAPEPKWPFLKASFVPSDHLLPKRLGANTFNVGELIMPPNPPSTLAFYQNKYLLQSQEWFLEHIGQQRYILSHFHPFTTWMFPMLAFLKYEYQVDIFFTIKDPSIDQISRAFVFTLVCKLDLDWCLRKGLKFWFHCIFCTSYISLNHYWKRGARWPKPYKETSYLVRKIVLGPWNGHFHLQDAIEKIFQYTQKVKNDV